MNAPKVSVILVNYRGAGDTIAALESLADVDWPKDRLQAVVVDNNSGDGSAARIRSEAPWAKLVKQARNEGFAGGCNAGVHASTGEFIAFLNSDARAHPKWIREAVTTLQGDREIGCVASKVLTWDGSETDFVEAGLTYYGQGFKLHHGEPDDGRWDEPGDILFATGAAMVMPRDLFEKIGGFDPRYFMFFEDVDLGWRLWIAGYRVRFVPTSIVYHRHHASMKRYGVWFEEYLLERNGLYTLYKNLNEENLARILPAALLLSTRRGMDRAGEDPTKLDLERSDEIDVVGDRRVAKSGLASMHAQDEFLTQISELRSSRDAVQALRCREDIEIFDLFNQPFISTGPSARTARATEDLRAAFGIDQAFGSRRILVATSDVLGERMAGPAIRAHQIASALSRHHEVVLASLSKSDLSHPDFEICFARSDDVERLVDWCDVIIFQGFFMAQYPVIKQSHNKVIVVDLYDPFQLEQLELGRSQSMDVRTREIAATVGVLNDQIARGDFFMCASEKQRDFWLGALSSLGRVNPMVYDRDASLRSLLAVVPFGLSDRPPVRTGPGIRGVVPGIDDDDKVIIWGGGIYNWFDPCTLIRAIGRLRSTVPNVRLFFMGTKHPNPDVPEMRVAAEAWELAEELELLDRHVFFNDGWVPYEERQNYLLDADIGVTTHFQHVETAFSFRTRVLDYFWADLPIVTTDGDALAAVIVDRGLGLTVPAEDPEALADALHRLLNDQELVASCRQSLALARVDFGWERALAPLLDFVRRARPAADRRLAVTEWAVSGPARSAPVAAGAWRWHGVRHDLGVVRAVYRDGGVKGLARQTTVRARKVVRRR